MERIEEWVDLIPNTAYPMATKFATHTVFPRIDAAATIYLVAGMGAVFIRGRLLFEGGIYSFSTYVGMANLPITVLEDCSQGLATATRISIYSHEIGTLCHSIYIV